MENHASCSGRLEADWKVGTVCTRVRGFALCDVAVLDGDTIVAAASGPVVFHAQGRRAGAKRKGVESVCAAKCGKRCRRGENSEGIVQCV